MCLGIGEVTPKPRYDRIGTVSRDTGVATHLPGADTFYLDAGTLLPVRHDQLAATDTVGSFAILEVAAEADGYLQAWGLLEAGGALTLLAEVRIPMFGDSAVIADLRP